MSILIDPSMPGQPRISAADLVLDPVQFERLKPYYDKIAREDPGFLIGDWINPYRGDNAYLVDRSDRFVGVFMPTRSGKGVSFAFPNALTWTHSMFLNDPKKELCAGTAWWRKYAFGQRIFIVEPMATDGNNARWNPLAEIRVRTEHEVTDAQNVSTAIVDPDGSGFDGESGVWKKRARDLLTGLILHVLYSPQYPEKSLRTIDAYLTDPGTPIRRKFQEMRDAVHDPQGKFGWRNRLTQQPTRTHPIVAQSAQEQLDRPDAEAGSVKSETQSYLGAYRNDTLGSNSAVSDFAIADIMRGIIPATVYFVVNPDSLELCKPYMRLFLNLVINRNTGPLSFDVNARPEKPYTYKLGFILDEFTSTLGKLDVFSRQLAFIAGYGLKPAVIVQDIEQIIETYGVHQNVTSNLHTLIFSAMNNLNSAKLFAEMMGNRTFHYTKRSRSYSAGPGGNGGSSSQESGGVPLLSATQVMEIPEDECVIKMAHMRPMLTKKLKYYSEETAFAQRVRPLSFPSDRLRPEQQTGWEERQAAERRWLDRAKENNRNRIEIQPVAQEQSAATKSALELIQRSFGSVKHAVTANMPDDDDDI